MGTDPIQQLPALRWLGSAQSYAIDPVAAETPIALFYNCAPYAVMMATPTDFEEFVIGFSLSEGIVRRLQEILSVRVRTLNNGVVVNVGIPPACHRALQGKQRNLAGRTSCGLCGAETLAQALRNPPPVSTTFCIDARSLQAGIASLSANQPLNKATGSLHAAAWLDARGVISHAREDVGRHNALDKLIGALAGDGVDLASGAALITSRASYEMVQKSATVGIQMLCAISAPTALAIEMAEACNVTLVAFARQSAHRLHPRRTPHRGSRALSRRQHAHRSASPS